MQTAALGTDRADPWQLASTCRWSGDRLPCTQQYSQLRGDCEGAPGNSTWTTTYASAADFVNEAAASPPAAKALTTAVTSTSGSCPSPSESRYQYDASGCLLHITSSSSSNLEAHSSTSYAAWDAWGRPTDGAFTNFRVSGDPPRPIYTTTTTTILATDRVCR